MMTATKLETVNQKKIFLLTPIPYGDGLGFWDRDSALCLPFLSASGFEVHLVTLDSPGAKAPADRPLILARREELGDPAWWAKQNPWGVFFLGWALPEYADVRRAIRSVTPRLIERLDSDGNKICILDPFYSVRTLAAKYQITFPSVLRFASVPVALLKVLLLSLVNRSGKSRVMAAMSDAGCVAAESPLAVLRTARACSYFSYAPPQVILLEHPIDASLMGRPGSHVKENVITMVGRWDDPKKSPGLALNLVPLLLNRFPDWELHIVGRASAEFRVRVEGLVGTYQTRFRYHERLTRPEIARLFSKTRICVVPSLCESFSNTMSEALCCGASVVGWQKLAAMHYIASYGFGTMSTSLSAGDFLDAVELEIVAWRDRRKPETIAQTWQEHVGGDFVARRLLDAMENLGNGKGISA